MRLRKGLKCSQHLFIVLLRFGFYQNMLCGRFSLDAITAPFSRVHIWKRTPMCRQQGLVEHCIVGIAEVRVQSCSDMILFRLSRFKKPWFYSDIVMHSLLELWMKHLCRTLAKWDSVECHLHHSSTDASSAGPFHLTLSLIFKFGQREADNYGKAYHRKLENLRSMCELVSAFCLQKNY